VKKWIQSPRQHDIQVAGHHIDRSADALGHWKGAVRRFHVIARPREESDEMKSGDDRVQNFDMFARRTNES